MAGRTARHGMAGWHWSGELLKRSNSWLVVSLRMGKVQARLFVLLPSCSKVGQAWPLVARRNTLNVLGWFSPSEAHWLFHFAIHSGTPNKMGE